MAAGWRRAANAVLASRHACILREARAALYAETGRLGREHAAAYLSGVRWVVDRLRRREVRGCEGPIVFMHWFVEDLKKPGPRNRVREDIDDHVFLMVYLNLITNYSHLQHLLVLSNPALLPAFLLHHDPNRVATSRLRHS